ncbi:RNA polymerase sigma factor [Jiulongibacter sp. NS-SX5]|uniref:RNA polymerase sigma factor n=1 Tax=Jiulongibacter sp. NS-SX5 TaxID=3463854 RepID=UPI004059C3D2
MTPKVYIEKNTELVKRCIHGDRKAQYELYRLYSRAMLSTCMRFIKQQEEAEDVLQEAFIDAFTKMSSFRMESSFGLWLKQIVVNKSINYLRAKKLELVDIEDHKYKIEPEEPLHIDEEDLAYQVESVSKAMEHLPAGYRTVLNMYLFEGYDHEEIAHYLDISESTSRTQYMRAKQKLVQLIRNGQA